MIKYIATVSYILSLIIGYSIIFVLFNLAFFIYIPTFPILLILELYCIITALTIRTLLIGYDIAELEFTGKILSLSGILLVLDILYVLKIITLKGRSKVKSRYKEHLRNFRSRPFYGYDGGYSYGVTRIFAIIFPIAYATIAPLISIGIILGVYYWNDLFLAKLSIFIFLIISPLIYYYISRQKV